MSQPSPEPASSIRPDGNVNINEISGAIVDSAIKVHRALGPGLLESAYEGCLACELRKRRHQVEVQKVLPVWYDGVKTDVGYRLDLLVDDAVIVELKAVREFEPIHEAQILTYLKLSGRKLGLLMNFNVRLIKEGIKRMANRL